MIIDEILRIRMRKFAFSVLEVIVARHVLALLPFFDLLITFVSVYRWIYLVCN